MLIKKEEKIKEPNTSTFATYLVLILILSFVLIQVFYLIETIVESS